MSDSLDIEAPVSRAKQLASNNPNFLLAYNAVLQEEILKSTKHTDAAATQLSTLLEKQTIKIDELISQVKLTSPTNIAKSQAANTR